MIHEAGGASEGHSSASRQEKQQTDLGLEELYLVHYPVGDFDGAVLVKEAGKEFSGEIMLAMRFQEIDLE